MNTNTVVASFATRSEAREAVRSLRAAGFPDRTIGVIARDTTRPADDLNYETDPSGSHWEEGTGIGAAAGGATGLGLGLAVAAGLIPGVGPVIAGGALLALLASVGAGAAAGSIVGGLVGLGVSEDEAEHYHAEVTSGRSVVAVRADARSDEARAILRRNGGAIRAVPVEDDSALLTGV